MSAIIKTGSITNTGGTQYNFIDTQTIFHGYASRIPNPFSREIKTIGEVSKIHETLIEVEYTYASNNASASLQVLYENNENMFGVGSDSIPDNSNYILVDVYFTEVVNGSTVKKYIPVLLSPVTTINLSIDTPQQYRLTTVNGDALPEDSAGGQNFLNIKMHVIHKTNISSLAVQYSIEYTDITIVDPTIQVILNIDVSGNLDIDPTYNTLTPIGLGSSDATATIDIPYHNFDGVFIFKTDSDDVDDVPDTDIKFACKKSYWNKVGNATQTKVQYSNSVVDTASRLNPNNTTIAQQTIAYDFVRHIASCITGGYAATDIFDNEASLRGALAVADDSIHASILDILEAAGSELIPLFLPINDDQNISKHVLNKLLTANSFTANRVHSTIHGRTGGSETWMSVPLMVGDSFVVKLTYNPNSTVPLGENEITSRSYQITMNLC
jgi:hypothetical protein